MLKLSEFTKKLTKHAKWLIHLEIFAFVAIITAAAVCTIVAESTIHYYEIIQIRNDLIAALRPCVAIAGFGAIAVQWLESAEKS